MAQPKEKNNGQSGSLLARVRRSSTFEWCKSLLIAVALALFIRWTVAEPFRIPSGSMEPTLHGDPRLMRGDRVFVNKFVYGWRYPLNGTRLPFTDSQINYAGDRLWHGKDPQRWDIVVFKTVEENALHTTLVKRIVGLPGERIHIADGKVYANDQPLELPPGMPPVYYESPHRPDAPYGISTAPEFSVVPPNHYLLLGDNSSNSKDGRYFGWVSKERILGRVSCIWWPPQRWRDFTGFSDTGWWRILVTGVLGLIVVRVFMGRSWRQKVVLANGRKGHRHYYINRLAFGLPVPFTALRARDWGAPQRGDHVLYEDPQPSKERPGMLLGRVAGLPGERVGFEANRLTINGEPAGGLFADREYPMGPGVGNYGRAKSKDVSLVPDGGYFILAETADPADHWDSRTLGWIPRERLVGRAVFAWWPPFRR